MKKDQSIFTIEKINQPDLHSEITSRLAKLILGSPAGSRLPTERELSKLLNVGRNSVREATKSLAFIGAIQVKHGNGTYVTSPEEANVERLIGLGLLVQRSSLQDIVEARRYIEMDIVTLASRNYTEDDRIKLEKNINKLKENVSDAQASSNIDLEFHAILAKASDNSVLIYFANGMRSLIRAWIDIKLSHAANKQEIINEILEEHQQIYEAVLSRNENLARELMSEHLRGAAKRLENAIGSTNYLIEDIFALLIPQSKE